ncbi:MAG: hypothetical protein A2X86_11710 [Bdellovibrionales bacterium GWA2_49_15]|nr:MAG: hypothetical protein A2X86_11710 [Bdellovibrionales bacterium GWA2_49_15]HAZ12583.1 hypothetical protein [Bdellovibrionales bacterium]
MIHHGGILAPEDIIDTKLGLPTSILKFEHHYQELQIDLTGLKRFPWWSHLFVLLALPFLMA